MCALGIRK
jgi:hypothetical protein